MSEYTNISPDILKRHRTDVENTLEGVKELITFQGSIEDSGETKIIPGDFVSLFSNSKVLKENQNLDLLFYDFIERSKRITTGYISVQFHGLESRLLERRVRKQYGVVLKQTLDNKEAE